MKQWNAALVASAVWVVAGCGGGGGSSTPAPASTPITVGGTVAEGRALAGAAVIVKCGSASGTATTAPDGSYSVDLASATLPCVVQATGSGGAPVYRSAVTGSGAGTYRANATPLSELVLAQLAGAAGTTPSALFAAFSSQSAAVSTATLNAALTYLRSTGLVDLTGVDPLADTLVVGNPLDLKLDALAAKLLAAGTTLTDLTTIVVSNPLAPDTVKWVVQPAATDCASLKSGSYRMINPYETDPLFRAHLLTIDAVTLGVTSFDNTGAPDPTGAGTLVSEGAGKCSFTADDATETNKVMVSSSGILVVYSATIPAGVKHVTIGLPEQTLPVAEMAGTFNRIGFSRNPSTATTDSIDFGLTTVDAGGHFTAESDCVDLQACTPHTGPFSTLTANPAGGFDLAGGAGSGKARVYAFKGANGTVAAVAISDDAPDYHGFSVVTKVRPQALPILPFSNSFWDFSVNANQSLSVLSDYTMTYNSVDTTNNVVTRTRNDGRVDTRTYNLPRAGLIYRATNTCTNAGAPANCSGLITMGLQGLGISVAGSLSTNTAPFFDISVNHP